MSVIFLFILLTIIETYIQQVKVPLPIANITVVFALFNIIIILLVVLILLILRNLIKLYFERKSKIIGARFRTKLIIAFVTLSLVPSILLFIVASKLFTYSIDNWFDIHIEKSLKGSLEVAQDYYHTSEESVLFFARQMSYAISEKRMFDRGNEYYLISTVKKKQKEYGLGSIIIFNKEGEKVTEAIDSSISTDILIHDLSELLDRALKGEKITKISSMDKGKLIVGMVPISNSNDINNREGTIGTVLVANYIPMTLVSKIEEIKKDFEEYKQQNLLKYPVKTGYIFTFLMITLLILFSAIWFGLYLARGITVPIQQLAVGTRSIAQGNLDFKIDIKTDDEIGILVDAFNQMTDNLRKSMFEIEKGSEDLKRTNIEMDRRMGYIETVLENIGTGVISIDNDGKILMINKAGLEILHLPAEDIKGKSYRYIFESSHLEAIRSMIKKIDKDNKESIEEQLNLMVSGRMLTLLVRVTVLRDKKDKYLGMVIVFDDLTEMIKAQKVVAWREVARGIAHEIKNPLTPIQLNTQRLRKKFKEGAPDIDNIVDECTKIIIKEVDGLKELVNEFSRFARMPESNPSLNRIHQIIEDVVLLYRGSHKDIKMVTEYDHRIDLIRIDAEQIKRVFINLIENSIHAINGGGIIEIKTFMDVSTKTVRIEVSDNGMGIHPKYRDKLFLPYFTTKKKGTGLGLAIANRIIADHNGYIKVKDNLPKGTTFVIKLPA
ncbi:MAG: HAMP domain-containing protein [Nitrospinae bacterium]|nr:HAMP domain-containing protein [Nitrospinota bacterium]